MKAYERLFPSDPDAKSKHELEWNTLTRAEKNQREAACLRWLKEQHSLVRRAFEAHWQRDYERRVEAGEISNYNSVPTWETPELTCPLRVVRWQC